jgi:UDP-3-O-[3-hydroxymyristoyl] glucosamine N-acyltransferase
MPFTAAQIAEHIQGEVVGDASTPLNGLAPAAVARPGDLTFAETPEYLTSAEASQASAVLVTKEITSANKVLIRVASPRIAMAKLLPIFFPPDAYPQGIHPSAVIHETATVEPTAHIGPNCVVGARASIGARTVLMGGNHVGRDVKIGTDGCLFPNVVIYPLGQIGNRVHIHAGSVIGSDGFGYVLDAGQHRKLQHIGNVIIGDDVEIGSNTSIDRGALGSTMIGAGTKVDNLVHVAHNVVIGRNCVVMGQVGFAGSTTLGDYCVIASQSGIAGHLKLGNQVTVGAKSGVMRDIEDGGRVLGMPALPDKETKRQVIAMQKLPELLKRMRNLEAEVQQLKGGTPQP